MDANTSFIDDLRDITENPTPHSAREAAHVFETAKPEHTFPCESCGGTGIYRGFRLHQPETKCFACNGRGYFKTSYADRLKARQQSAQRKVNAKELAQGAFNEAHPGLIERLKKEAGWNDFANKMLASFQQWDGLTDKQVAACEAMIAKIDARQAERNARREANSGAVDTSKIEAMFATAKLHGLNKLAFVADGLKIKPAKETSRNAGALYVTKGNDYQGKVLGGRFYPVNGVDPGILSKLAEIAANPSQAARDYGKKTGTCCCCGRELTDPVSVANGIGPICASNWGL